MPENAPSPAGSLGKLSKPQRSIEGCLAELIVRYHRYPSIEVARMIRQLETELANVAHFGGAVRERNGIHKFAIGQKVRFTPEMGQVANRGETFVVMRHLPEASGAFQYQIKSEMDGHARVVRENQLADL